MVDGTFKTMCMHNTFGCATHRVAAPHHTYIYGDIHIWWSITEAMMEWMQLDVPLIQLILWWWKMLIDIVKFQ